jgi:xanthine dehydrogenase YagS FAD-binding subunit
MQAFEYANPTTLEQAVSALSGPDAAILAGGTDLISLMKDDVEAPKRLVNLKSVKQLQGISYDAAQGLRIGALTTLDELVEAGKVKEEYPSLIQAAEGVRSPQIHTMGTVGGDLCQRPRCWYYRNGFGLLATREGKSMVTEGDNRYHAILGTTGPAYFVNPSSFAPALIALGAKVRIAGPNGTREVPVEQFFRVPAREGEKENALAREEIVTEIIVPPATRVRNATYEIRQKEALDWPLVAAAVALEMNGRTVTNGRVVLGHVAPVPWFVQPAGAVLAGKEISESVAEQAAQAAVHGARPLSRNAYKVRLARVAVKRALLRAAGMEV